MRIWLPIRSYLESAGLSHSVWVKAFGGIIVISLGSCGARSVPDLACPSPKTACSGACVTLDGDPQNSGACGNVCAAATVCYAGACATSCGGGTTQCGQSCVDTSVDSRHCGTCDTTCAAGNACVSGTCTSTCAQSQTLCTPDGGAYCATTSSDNANCGACGSNQFETPPRSEFPRRTAHNAAFRKLSPASALCSDCSPPESFGSSPG